MHQMHECNIEVKRKAKYLEIIFEKGLTGTVFSSNTP